MPSLFRVTDLALREQAILGANAFDAQETGAMANLINDVISLYEADYIATWDGLLADLNTVPITSLGQLVEFTNVASGESSPIRRLLESIGRETELSGSWAAFVTPEQNQRTQAIAIRELSIGTLGDMNFEVLHALTKAVENGEIAPPGTVTAENFKWLHDFVGLRPPEASNAPPQIAGLPSYLEWMDLVHDQSNQLLFSTDDRAVDALQFALTLVLNEPMPPVVERWTLQIARGVMSFDLTSLQSNLSRNWQANILPLCQSAETRFPFDPQSETDVSLQDFTRLFAPGGLIDTFVRSNLVQYIDLTTAEWTWNEAGAQLGLSSDLLRQLQNAARIRDAFFPSGAAPLVRFRITPEALDPKVAGLELDLGDQRLTYYHGASEASAHTFSWPTTDARSALVLVDGDGTALATAQETGVWSTARLLQAADQRNTDVGDKFRLVYTIDGYVAILKIQFSTITYPFSNTAIENFACPKEF